MFIYSNNTLNLFFKIQSVVFLTRLPFINLMTELVDIIAPEFFDNGEPCLEAGE